MASNLRVDTILPSSGTTLGIGTASGTINFLGNSNITTTGDVTVGGNLGVGGTLTYEDVTNIDSVGVITARTDINIGDSIIHIGDTNTKIRFPAADTITAETGGSERVRITSGGSVLVGKTNTSLTTDGIRMDSNAAMITASSTSTNQATANGGSLYLINSSATDNNFSHIGGYNSNGLVTSQINFVNTSHSSRTGDISFRTHDGSSMPERLRISSAGIVTKPAHPVFDAARDGGNVSGANVIVYDTVFVNIGSHYDNSNGRFTAPVTGVYFFSFGCIKSGNNNLARLYLRKNGTTNLQNNRHLRMPTGGDGYGENGAITYIVSLTASDYVQVYLSEGTVHADNDNYTYFNGYLIG